MTPARLVQPDRLTRGSGQGENASLSAVLVRLARLEKLVEELRVSKAAHR